VDADGAVGAYDTYSRRPTGPMTKIKHEKFVLDALRTLAIFDVAQKALCVVIGVIIIIEILRHVGIPVNHIFCAARIWTVEEEVRELRRPRRRL